MVAEAIDHEYYTVIPGNGTFPPRNRARSSSPNSKMRAKAVSGEVFRVATADGGQGGPPPARRWPFRRKRRSSSRAPSRRRQASRRRFAPGGSTVYTEPAEIAAHADTADIGISGVEFGVAETGSVFQDGYAIATRLVTILPPLHVVFLPSANIVPDIPEAFEIIAKNFERGYVGFITGPSRTADIERVLTIGVHGPGRFAIIAVDEEPKGGAA